MVKSLHTRITTNNRELFNLYYRLTMKSDLDERTAIILMCYLYVGKDILAGEDIKNISEVIRFKLLLHQWGVDY